MGSLLLAVETATRVLSVALLEGEACILEICDEEDRLHSERLLPAVDRLLREAGVALDRLAGIALSVGPGSFTGLRVGLATVKGLAFGTSTPVAPVSTLAALAAQLSHAGPVAALLDARRGEVYAGWVAVPGSLELHGESVYTPEGLAGMLPEACALAVGEGAEGAAEALRRRLAGCVATPVVASAAVVGRLGWQLLAAGRGAPAARVTPRYVRRAEAEVRRTGARFEDDLPPF